MDKYSRMEELTDALEIARIDGDTEAEASALYGIGSIYLEDKVLEAAEDFFEQCARVCRTSGQHEGLVQVLLDLGDMALSDKQYSKADVFFQEAQQACEEMGNPQLRTRVLDRVGDLALTEEDLDRALDASLKGLELCRDHNDTIGSIYFLEKIIPLYKAKGSADEVEANYRQFMTCAEKIGDRERMALALVGLADVYERTRKTREAIPYLEMAHDVYLRLGKEEEAGLIRGQLERLGDDE